MLTGVPSTEAGWDQFYEDFDMDGSFDWYAINLVEELVRTSEDWFLDWGNSGSVPRYVTKSAVLVIENNLSEGKIFLND